MFEDLKLGNSFWQISLSCLYNISKSVAHKLVVKSATPQNVVLVYLLCSLFFIPSSFLHHNHSTSNKEPVSSEIHYTYMFLALENELESDRNEAQKELKEKIRKYQDCYTITKNTGSCWYEKHCSVQFGSNSSNHGQLDVMRLTIVVMTGLAVLAYFYQFVFRLMHNGHQNINNGSLSQLDSLRLMSDSNTSEEKMRSPGSCQEVILLRPDDSAIKSNNWIVRYICQHQNKIWILNKAQILSNHGKLILSFGTEATNFNLHFKHQVFYDMFLNNIDLLKIRQTFTSDSRHLAEIWKRHENLSRALAQFKSCQIMHDLTGCENAITQISMFSKFECSLQHGVLLFAKGARDEAIHHLEALYIFDHRTDIRRLLYLAKMFTSMNKPDLALHRLEDALSLANDAPMQDLKVQIKREFATTLMVYGEYELALVHINHISQQIHSESREEKCCFYLTAAVCTRLVGRDSRPWLKQLQILLHQKRWPTMLRHFLNEVAFLHRENGLMPSRTDFTIAVNLFEILKRNHPETCEWLLL
ncbi:hypothetical protein CAEBREN_13225 [Caenorhabditis brenneri]|uniref:Uncharacterized protein n=1 Tax=Caenorhabditis brenneri TaxID=135651 RepID=G0N4E4_CAEBE|nr:hypothetical protein CAEBREN_13225 [Caenorhabditis brenneri]